MRAIERATTEAGQGLPPARRLSAPIVGEQLPLVVDEGFVAAKEVFEAAAAMECPVAYIAILDRQGKIAAVNRSWRDRAAAVPELASVQDVGGDYLAYCAALTGDCAHFGQQAATGIRDVLAGGLESFSVRYRCLGHGGLRWFRLSVSPLSCHPGSEGGAVIAHEDISEQLRLSEERTRQVSVHQASADPVFVVDQAGRIGWANEAFLGRQAPQAGRGGQLADISLAEAGGETLGEIIAALPAHRGTLVRPHRRHGHGFANGDATSGCLR